MTDDLKARDVFYGMGGDYRCDNCDRSQWHWLVEQPDGRLLCGHMGEARIDPEISCDRYMDRFVKFLATWQHDVYLSEDRKWIATRINGEWPQYLVCRVTSDEAIATTTRQSPRGQAFDRKK